VGSKNRVGSKKTRRAVGVGSKERVRVRAGWGVRTGKRVISIMLLQSDEL
jgi:hypothetical protein